MVTIKQVAKLAGVSPTTASYALNNRPEVKEETRRKVVEAAKRLHYVPNKAAQSFRNGKTNTITVITSENIECGNTFSSEFFGILAGAREKRYDVLVKLVGADLKNPAEINRLLGNHLSDGCLLLGNQLDFIAKHIAENHLKGVLLSSHSEYLISQVNVDGRKWIHNMTDLVFEQGKRNPAYFTFIEETEEEILREQGFLDSLREHGAAAENAVYRCGAASERLKSAVLSCVEHKNDAIVCWNDVLAVQVIGLLNQLGKNIPEEIAVTGFDDNVYYNSLECSLTTVRQPFYEKGRTAIQLLIAQIEDDRIEPQNKYVECSIVRRKSL